MIPPPLFRQVTAALVLALLLCRSEAAQAQALFAGVRAGMTAEQVLAAVPGAGVPAEPRHLQGGDEERVSIQGLRLGGHEFVGRVYYRDDQLSQLMLDLVHRDLPPTQALAAYDAVLAAMTARHGTPSRQQDFLDDPLAPEREARWRSPDADIVLLYLGNGDGRGRFLSLLNVVFRPLPADR